MYLISSDGTTADITGVIDNLNYVGTHEIRVNGQCAGKYNSIPVKDFTLTIVNPCPTSNIISDTIDPMEVTVYGGKV